MIVISQALALALAGQRHANLPVIGWETRVVASGIAADTEAAGYPATNLANHSTAARWQAEDTTDQTIVFTIDAAEDVDYIAIARHNLGTGAVAVSVEWGDGDSPETWTALVEEFVPADDGPILCRFVAGAYDRLRISLQPGSVAPRMAVVYAGKLLVLERGEQSGFTPIPFAHSDEVFRGRSQSGDYLGSIVLRQGLQSQINIQHLSFAWFLANMKPFIDAAPTQPFFYAWAPQEYPDQVGFAWTTADVRPTLNAPRLVDVQMSLDAVKL